MRSCLRGNLLRALLLPALGLLLLQCGSGSDPVVSQGTQYQGPFYFAGTITTLPAVLTPVPQTTEVPVCNVSQITGFYAPGTVIPFQASLVSGGFTLNQSDPDRVSFRINGTDTARNIGIDINLRDFNQEVFFASTPVTAPPEEFRAYADIDLTCNVTNRDMGRAMAFNDDFAATPTWGASDVLTFSEVTLQSDGQGNQRLVAGSPVGGCFTITTENTYPNPGGGGNQNSRVCVRACFRIPVQFPSKAVPNLDPSVNSCPAGASCPSCP